MATYGDDLTDITDAESGDTWVEMSGYDQGDAPSEGETDYYIQGSSCASCDTNNKTGLASGCVNYGSSLAGSFTDGETVVLIWHVILPGNAMDTFANGGYRAIVGSSTSVFGAWKVGGRDFGRNPYGGWHCYAVDPSKTPDYNTGSWTPGSSGSGYQYFGAATNLTSNIAKGTQHGFDAIRYGRGEIYCTGTGCDFAGMAQYNDYNDGTNGYNRFGLFQAQPGGYLWKGLMSIGQSGTSATFSDANKTITIDDTPAVYSSFNRIAIRNASTTVSWTNITFQALGTTSPGEFEMVENATFVATGCSFKNMGTFTFLSNGDAIACTFTSCGAIDTGGGVFTGTKVQTSTVAADASAVLWNVATDPDGYLDDMEISKGTNAHHAIGFGTSAPLTMTLVGCDFSGFNASDGQNDSTFYFADRGSDVTWTLNLQGCSGNFTYKKARSGDTVIIVPDSVTTSVTCTDAVTGAVIEGVAVTIRTAGSGPYPYNLSITSLTQTGGTATAVCASAHGLQTGQKVEIEGASPNAYNRIKTITVTTTTQFTFPIDSGTTSPATGTITCKAVIIDAVTGASGVVTDSRVFSSDQAVAGWAAKGTRSPLYKRQPVSGTVDSADGVLLTAVMTPDD